MNFTILGEVPSKKNSRINTRSGRSFPNKRFMEWHDNAIAQILTQLSGTECRRIPKGQRVAITFKFYHGDMRKRDSDNQVSSVLDTLVDAGVISDDNWQIVPVKHVYDYYDEKNARCVVIIDAV